MNSNSPVKLNNCGTYPAMMRGISAASRSSINSASTRSRCKKMATSAPPLDQSRFTLMPSTSSREAMG